MIVAACAHLLVLTTLVHCEGLRMMAGVLQYLPGPLSMLAGVEALKGLLLIGWSGSILFVTMERFWGGPAQPPSAP